ncbi:DUF4185 domain-containing protein [Nocardioides mangrovi]|uniref:DUF4185 domain-containing protein n=1 Tax=Nocardioides mangrovi TaxID=2874580 RepID=A0ABS7UA86_9ACTN|nr:DUF4185 domain-containing protein [Nocardioides mangrovi]MBZ5737905.1 DUF4185 domain-containing protein [Nocardioides mangrovi]
MRARRLLLAGCLLVVLVQAVLLATMARGGGDREPHDVPILIAAPAVVAHQLATEANAMPADPFDATWTDDAADARGQVEDGEVVAAVLVDLRGTRDVVLVHAALDDDLTDAVVDRVRAVEKSRDRTVEVQRLAPSDAGGASRIRWYALCCGLLGLAFALAVSLTRGPVAASAARGVVRVVGLGAASLGGAALLQLVPALRLPGHHLAVVAIGAALSFALGAITFALEALLGLVGLVAMAATTFLLSTPLLSGTSRYLLPTPWPTVTPWLPCGSALDALADVAYLDPGRSTRSVLLLAGAGALAVVALLLARWLRDTPDETDAAGTGTHLSLRHWRAWVVGAVVPLGVLMGVAVSVVPTALAGTPFLPSQASETSCVQDASTARSVPDLNHQIASLQGTPAFKGADVGADVQLQDGRFLLVFGDTLRGPSFDGPTWARNSMMLWDTDCVSVVLPHSKGALIPDRADGVGYWPMSVAVAHRPGYDLVVVSTQRVATTGGGSFDFANVGPALAVFVVEAGGTPQLIATEDVGADDSDTGRPEWGAALAGTGDTDDDWLYLYGTAREEDATTPGFTLQVARVRPDDVLETEDWRYWDGSRWQRDAGSAAVVLPAADGVSQTLSVFRQGDRWYALSKLGGDIGDQVAIWTAPGPTGPFTLSGPVATLPTDPDSGEVTYMPLAHPQILDRPGTMVASYSRNNTDAKSVEADPTLYRPRFLRIRLPH